MAAKFETVKTWSTFKQRYMPDVMQEEWRDLGRCNIHAFIRSHATELDWQTLVIRCLPLSTRPNEIIPAHKEFQFSVDFDPDFDPVLLLHYSTLSTKGWYLQLYFQPNRDPGSQHFRRIILVQMGPRVMDLERVEMGAKSKPRLTGSFAPGIRLGQEDQILVKEASEAEVEAAAEEVEAKVDEKAEARARRAKEQASNPKPKLTRMQREIADHNAPPVPRTGIRIVEPPEEVNSLPSSNVLSGLEDLEMAGTRILAMAFFKKDTPEIRQAHKVLSEIRQARDQEEALKLSTTTDQVKEPEKASALPSAHQPAPATSAKRKQEGDDDSGQKFTNSSQSTLKRSDTLPSETPKKSKLNRELAKLASHNELGDAEVLPSQLPSRRKGNTSLLSSATFSKALSQTVLNSVKKEDEIQGLDEDVEHTKEEAEHEPAAPSSRSS